MTIHLLKPALRIQDVAEFQRRQKNFLTHFNGEIVYPVWTSRKPQQMDALINGGSVYWIVKKAIQCRQAVIGFEAIEREGEKPSYFIYCDPQLVQTKPMEKRPFQGWRYLKPDQAPADVGAVDSNAPPPPPDMANALREAGLL